jgi:hypothetical protein
MGREIAEFLRSIRSLRDLLAVLLLVTAAGAYYMDRYAIYLDRPMLRNILATGEFVVSMSTQALREQVNLSAHGNRLRFFRTQGAITMDTAGVETVDFNALGGADTVTVNDLSGTDVTSVAADLAGVGGTLAFTAWRARR